MREDVLHIIHRAAGRQWAATGQLKNEEVDYSQETFEDSGLCFWRRFG